MDSNVLDTEEGVYGYFIKNMVEHLFPEDNLPENTYSTVGSLKTITSDLLANFNDEIKKILSDDTNGLNELIKGLFKEKDNLLVAGHLFNINSKRLPTDFVKENYLKTKNTSGKPTTYKMSPMGLIFHPKALEALDLFAFNSTTTIQDKDTEALIFTNNTLLRGADDIFIARKYDR